MNKIFNPSAVEEDVFKDAFMDHWIMFFTVDADIAAATVSSSSFLPCGIYFGISPGFRPNRRCNDYVKR